MTTATEPRVRLVAEKVREGTPGEGYEVGYEIPAENYTNSGWFGKTAEEGLTRLLVDEVEFATNTARHLSRQQEVISALAEEVIRRTGIEVDTGYKADRYAMEQEFGGTRIREVERLSSDYQERLTNLHRCPHGRLCLDHCYDCGGPSVGGTACDADDQNFWKHWPDSPR